MRVSAGKACRLLHRLGPYGKSRSWPLLVQAAFAVCASGQARAADAGAPPPWPFDQPPVAVLRQAPRKVLAHYHCPYPISLDNRPEEDDYYSRGYLAPGGEGGRHRAGGGHLRERPFPTDPAPGATGLEWLTALAEQDVRWAVAAGLDGFIVNFVTDADSTAPHYRRALAVLEAAARVAPGFKVVLSPDCVCHWKVPETKRFVDFMRPLHGHPAVLRLGGKPVLAPWGAQVHPPEFWQEVLTALKTAGLDVAFVPCPHGLRGDWLDGVAPLCAGLMDSSACSSLDAARGAGAQERPARAHARGLPFYVQTVRPQDGRPKSNCYWEAGNSRLFRACWDIAIRACGPTDWAQLFTWNDYGEFSNVRPSTGIQYGFFDLAAYYTTWFKTGRQPPIVRDVLYYFHRLQSTTARPDTSRQTRGPWSCMHSTPLDEVELLAFLTADGTLAIELGGQTHTRAAPAGITSFTVPLAEGTPSFTLSREGRTLIHTRSRWTISDRIIWQNLLYHGGSSAREPNLAALPPAPAAPVLELRCNETWGPYVYDASGNKNHGLLSDSDRIRHSAGWDAQGLFFAPTNNEVLAVSVPDHAALRPAQLSVVAWVRTDAKQPALLVAKEEPGARQGYALGLEDGQLVWRVGNGVRTVQVAAPVSFAAPDWHAVCATFDGQALRLYVDGGPAASTACGNLTIEHTDEELRLGARLAGRLDEIRIYPRPLSAAEVAALQARDLALSAGCAAGS